MIVAGVTNQDSSFFSVESSDIESEISTKDIISFSYIEELQRINSGVLSFYDPLHVYSKILQVGISLNISFGYKQPDLSENALLITKKNSTQVFGSFVRKGIKAYVMNPSGTSNNKGVTIFNCSFYGKEVLNTKNYFVHSGKTKGDLIRETFREMGCSLMEVNFAQGTELIGENTPIMQNETEMKFLTRLAKEWGTFFRISYTARGEMTGIFISPKYLEAPSVVTLSSGALSGTTAFLEYGQGVSNVLEYSWKNHAGDNGSGDNVITKINSDGTITFLRYVTKDDKITVYELNMDAIRKALESKETFAEKWVLEKDFLRKKDFESVKWAFTASEQSTAAQGLGYSMNVKTLGNPLLSAPLRIIFGKGFPVWFTPKEDKEKLALYYGKKVAHTIDNTGYKCDIEIQDSFTLFGGSFV